MQSLWILLWLEFQDKSTVWPFLTTSTAITRLPTHHCSLELLKQPPHRFPYLCPLSNLQFTLQGGQNDLVKVKVRPCHPSSQSFPIGFSFLKRKAKFSLWPDFSDFSIAPCMPVPFPGSDLLMPQAFTCYSLCLECCSLHSCMSPSLSCFKSLLKYFLVSKSFPDFSL